MTRLANVGRSNVRCRLTRGRRAIVTGNTGIRSGRVIKGRHQPGTHQMANFTRLGSGHMSGALTDGNHAIMTGVTSTEHFVVIHRGNGQPTHR